MKKFFSISLLTFKEMTRDKFFLGVVFFFVFYLFFCIFLGKLSVGHAEKVMRDAGLVGIELTTIILLIFSFIQNFYRERDSRILEVYLSHFSAGTYISGKIFGFVLLSLLYLSFSAIGFSFILGWYGAFHYSVLLALYPLFLKAVIVVFIACLFSSLFSSPTIALLSGVFLYLSAKMVPTALEIVHLYAGKLQQVFVRTLYLALPNMERLDLAPFALQSSAPSPVYFFWVTLYTLAYCMALWLITLFVFRRKEF